MLAERRRPWRRPRQWAQHDHPSHTVTRLRQPSAGARRGLRKKQGPCRSQAAPHPGVPAAAPAISSREASPAHVAAGTPLTRPGRRREACEVSPYQGLVPPADRQGPSQLGVSPKNGQPPARTVGTCSGSAWLARHAACPEVTTPRPKAGRPAALRPGGSEGAGL